MEFCENCIAFVSHVKEKYKGRDDIFYREKQWPPRNSNKLISLEVVERKTVTYCGTDQQDVNRTPLPYQEILSAGKEPVKRVLVNGGAGIGKTTLCTSISGDWASGHLFQEFQLLLLLPLRHRRVCSAKSLCDLIMLMHPDKDVCESVVKHLTKTGGRNVLIIGDGWDEIGESERQEESFLFQLLFNILSFASIIITSRPSASAQFHEYDNLIHRYVEVAGFTKENIEAFIHSEFAGEEEKATVLLKELENNPLIESVCSIPLNCVIICHLWKYGRQSLPTTMTELYTKIILSFMYRNLRKLDLYKGMKSLNNFNSIPEGLQKSWWLLCKFAFQTILKNQLVYSQEELAAYFPPDSAFDESILFLACYNALNQFLKQNTEYPSILSTSLFKSTLLHCIL